METYAIYARYSSDGQNEKSASDQLFDCEKFVESRGGLVVARYSDEAITGATAYRPQFQQMVNDAIAGKFDIIVAESLGRLSRNLGDIAKLYEMLTFHGIKIITKEDNVVDENCIAFKGAWNAMFLKQLSRMTRRGLEGAIRAGRNPGSRAYGYDVVRKFKPDGTPVRGELVIDEFEAQIVKRIFIEFAEGKSPRQIVKDLNAEGIPGPRGELWRESSIRGHRKIGAGILHHQIYIGIRIWNRKSYVRNPMTGKKEPRLNPESEWIITKAPELAIISDNLWKSVQARHAEIAENGLKVCKNNRLTGCRRNRYLLSGLLVCGECGGPFTLGGGKDRYSCSRFKEGHGCSNKNTIRRQVLENEVLSVFKDKFLKPEVIERFIDRYTVQLAEVRKANGETKSGYRSELKKVNQSLGGILKAIEEGIITATTRSRLEELEARKAELEGLLYEEPVPIAPQKDLVSSYLQMVDDLSNAIDNDSIRHAAINALRPLIEKIILYPVDKGMKADFYGTLAGLISLHARTEDTLFTSSSQISANLGSEDSRYLTPLSFHETLDFPYWVKLNGADNHRPL